MRILIFLIRWGFPLLLITDLSSELLKNEFLLNISRTLRILLLVFFIIENLRYFRLIKKFYFFRYFFLFNLVLFIYLFTDEVFLDGFWMYSKTLFWTLGLNVLYIYNQKNIFTVNDFLKVIKKVIFISFFFTLLFYFNGDLKSEYNVAAYLVLFMYPFLLLSTNGYKNNMIYVLFSAISILITLKRGAILAFAVSNVIYYLIILSNTFSIKKLFNGTILLFFIVLIPLYLINTQQSDQDQGRFESDQFDVNNDDAGSGRIGMYTSLYMGWITSDNIFIGRGNRQDFLRFKSSKGTYAHSDIFGFLYNFGLLGISLILLLYFKLIKFYYVIKKKDKKNASIILSVLAIFILINLYSGMLTGSTNPIYFFSILAYLQIKNETKKSTYINKSA